MDSRPAADEYSRWLNEVGPEREITRIDWESFPTDCQPEIADADLPIRISIPAMGRYRTDAAQYGILAHSPYCPYCSTAR